MYNVGVVINEDKWVDLSSKILVDFFFFFKYEQVGRKNCSTICTFKKRRTEERRNSELWHKEGDVNTRQ